MARPPVSRQKGNQVEAVSLPGDFGDVRSVAIGDFPRSALARAVNPAAMKEEVFATCFLSAYLRLRFETFRRTETLFRKEEITDRDKNGFTAIVANRAVRG
jgi:hypothetical protein